MRARALVVLHSVFVVARIAVEREKSENLLLCGVYKVEHAQADGETFASGHTRFLSRPCSMYPRVESYDMDRVFLPVVTLEGKTFRDGDSALHEMSLNLIINWE